MVVMLHTCCWSPVHPLNELSAATASENINFFLKGVYQLIIGPTMVPAFFFISGFLYFYSVGTGAFTFADYRRKTKRRLFTLLIPYLIWNAVRIVELLLTGSLAASELTLANLPRLFLYSNSCGRDIVDVLGNPQPTTGPFLGPLWFIRDLMMMCLVSPLVWLVVKKAKMWGVLAVGLLFISRIWPVGLYPFSNCSVVVFWFTFGAFFSVNGVNFVDVFRKVRWPVAAAGIVCFVAYMPSCQSGWTWYSIINERLLNIALVICIVNIAAWGLDRKVFSVNSDLSKASYMVYVAHWFLLAIAVKPYDILASKGLWTVDLLTWPLFTIAIVAICVGAHICLRKYAPWVLRITLGQKF